MRAALRFVGGLLAAVAVLTGLLFFIAAGVMS